MSRGEGTVQYSRLACCLPPVGATRLLPASAVLGPESAALFASGAHIFPSPNQRKARQQLVSTMCGLYTKLDSKDGDGVMSVGPPGGGTHGIHLPLCGYWSFLPWSSTPITAQAIETFI